MSKAGVSREPALELELEISETRFGLLPEDLFRLAVRQNTQRAFLFVSKVLGKHLPVEPAALLAAGKLLALAWLDQKDEQGWAGLLKGSTASPFSEVWDRLEPVSYTHLDVYKRQEAEISLLWALAHAGVDVLYFSPALLGQEPFEKHFLPHDWQTTVYEQDLPLEPFPQREERVRASTTAYNASRCV